MKLTMKHAYVAMVVILLLFVIAMALGCTSPEVRESWRDYDSFLEVAQADGVVDATEQTELLRLFQDASGKTVDAAKGAATGWKELLGTGVGAVLASVLTGNYVRNRGLPGTTRIPKA